MGNQTQEALKMAIEALDNACMKIEKWTKGGKWTAGKEASLKCKEALAQSAQDSEQAHCEQPVAWMFIGTDENKYLNFYKCLDEGRNIPLYAKENVDD